MRHTPEKRRLRHIKHLIVAAGFLFSGIATAQLEEIIVTATRMGETDLQDTPLAITAFTAEEINRMAVRDVRDLQIMTPGLTIAENTGSAQVYIRGVGTNTAFTGSNPSTTVHVDGVYISNPIATFDNFLDVERVEVLRGPQGTLYGRNSVGGTINVISRKPSYEAMESKVQATFGDYDLRRLEGYLSGPVGDNFALGISAQWSEHDGYRENVTTTGNDIESEDMKAVRAQARWSPSDSLEIIMRADYNENDNIPYGFHTFVEPPPVPLSASIFGDFDKVSASYPHFGHIEGSGINLDINFAINERWSLKSLTAYRDHESELGVDSDASELDIFRVFALVDQDQFSQEFHLIGNWDKATALIGAYYFEEDLASQSFINILPAGITRRVEPELDTATWAVFAEGTYFLTDQWSLTLGGRYTEEKKDYLKIDGVYLLSNPTPAIDTPPGPQIANLSFPPESRTYDAFTPHIGLQYTANENVLVYGSIKEGFKSGGFNFTAIFPGGFEPETMWAYEVGLKTTSSNQQFRFNVAAFYYDIEDLQVQAFVVPGQVDISNAATAEIKGLEIEAIHQITDDFSLAFNLAYLDAAYGEYPEAPITGGGTFQASGNRLNSAPEWSGAITANYAHPFGTNSFYARGEFGFQTEVFFTTDNNDVDSQDAYGLVNLSAGFTLQEGRYDIGVWARNLMDEQYVTTTAGFPLVRAGRAGPPRTYGIRFSWNY
jgi:iron complex outermembrane receptor protein